MNTAIEFPILLRTNEVCSRLGIARATLENWVRSGRFPHPVVIGPGVRAWRQDVLKRWLAERERAVA